MRRITILVGALAALMLVPAAQALAVPVHVSIEGSGAGEISSAGGVYNPIEEEFNGVWEGSPPIECSYASPGPAGGVCANEATYASEFEGVALTAYPAAGSEISAWQVTYEGEGPWGPGFSVGCGTPGPLPHQCRVGYESEELGEVEGVNVYVTALLCLEGQTEEECLGGGPVGPPLTTIIEEGQGTVVSNPAGIECTGSTGHECTTEEIAEGTKVTLTASPASGYLFKSWKGCDKGGANGRQCTVTLSGAKTAGAKFVKAPSLAISKTSGSGPGIISTSPGGVNCGYTCLSGTAQYKEGSLTIKDKPAKHFHLVEFKNGTGSAASCDGVSGESCTISSFDSNSSVEAEFAEDAKHTLSLSKEGGGQGFVKTKATGISCGYTCSAGAAEYFATETVEVSVTLNKGTGSVDWTTGAGTCTGSALTCTVPMSASHSLVAKFE